MRDVPALQAADLIAWCLNHQDSVSFYWQSELLDLRMESVLLDDAALSKPDPLTIEFIKHCKLPRSAPTP
jgi:hypothetical protein